MNTWIIALRPFDVVRHLHGDTRCTGIHRVGPGANAMYGSQKSCVPVNG